MTVYPATPSGVCAAKRSCLSTSRSYGTSLRGYGHVYADRYGDQHAGHEHAVAGEHGHEHAATDEHGHLHANAWRDRDVRTHGIDGLERLVGQQLHQRLHCDTGDARHVGQPVRVHRYDAGGRTCPTGALHEQRVRQPGYAHRADRRIDRGRRLGHHPGVQLDRTDARHVLGRRSGRQHRNGVPLLGRAQRNGLLGLDAADVRDVPRDDQLVVQAERCELLDVRDDLDSQFADEHADRDADQHIGAAHGDPAGMLIGTDSVVSVTPSCHSRLSGQHRRNLTLDC